MNDEIRLDGVRPERVVVNFVAPQPDKAGEMTVQLTFGNFTRDNFDWLATKMGEPVLNFQFDGWTHPLVLVAHSSSGGRFNVELRRIDWLDRQELCPECRDDPGDIPCLHCDNVGYIWK